MRLLDLVVRDAIIPELRSTKRDEALAEMLDALVAAGGLPASLRDECLESIIKRENHGSTGFGHGIAVPHVKHAAIDRMVVGIGGSVEGVEFNALDRQPVFSVFLLISPANRPEDHLDAMEAIVGNLSKLTHRRFLRQARTADEVVALLEEWDAKAQVG
ncbi:MAG: PTS sugar transporter subunit IIA [Phycisphaeraceae bacterium]|nr:PTS sugar transporter subunit IIA [Phycisphaeraceae bacterium]